MKEPTPPSDEQLAAERIVRHTLALEREAEAASPDEQAQANLDVLAAEAQVLAHEPHHSHRAGHCTCLACITKFEQQQRQAQPEPQPGPPHSSQFITSTEDPAKYLATGNVPYVRQTPKLSPNAPAAATKSTSAAAGTGKPPDPIRPQNSVSRPSKTSYNFMK